MKLIVGHEYIDRAGRTWRVLATDRKSIWQVVVLDVLNGDVGTRSAEGCYSDHTSDRDIVKEKEVSRERR